MNWHHHIRREVDYNFEIWNIANGKFYRLSYLEDPLKVPETLPLVNKMVDSFQVKTEAEHTSNNSAFENFQNKYCPPMSLVACAPPPEPEEP
jgi:hypothetical protein